MLSYKDAVLWCRLMATRCIAPEKLCCDCGAMDFESGDDGSRGVGACVVAELET